MNNSSNVRDLVATIRNAAQVAHDSEVQISDLHGRQLREALPGLSQMFESAIHEANRQMSQAGETDPDSFAELTALNFIQRAALSGVSPEKIKAYLRSFDSDDIEKELIVS